MASDTSSAVAVHTAIAAEPYCASQPGHPAGARQGAARAYGRTHQDAMLARHAPLVRRLALQLLGRLPASVELDDLIQAGTLGLLDAIQRYREVPSAQFETYATQRVRGAMLDELRSMDWVPRGVRERARRVENAVRLLTNTLGRPPTEAETAAELELSLAQYQALLQEAHGAQLLYIDDLETPPEPVESDPAPGLLEVRETDDPLAVLLASGLRNTLVEAIKALPEREKLLLSLYYEQDLNLKEIGLVLNVGEARVCQLRSQAIARLRAWVRRQD